MDAGIIEMSSNSKGGFKDIPSLDEEEDDHVDDDFVLDSQEPFEWEDSQVKRQNLCFMCCMATFIVILLSYVVGGMYFSENLAPKASSNGGKAGNDLSVCDHSAYSDWLDARVTKADGVKYEVIEKLDHDHKAFVQGLTYADGTLWESNGLYGKSTVRILDAKTADVIKSIDMDKSLFGEGMAYRDGKLYQITWKSKRGFIYDAKTLDLVQEYTFSTTLNEGWGITWDPCTDEFIVTDGSANIHFWDVNTLQETRKIEVKRMDGKPAKELNEIEWYRGRILANVWYEDVLVVINPATGVIEKEYDFSELFPKKERRQLKCDVFNGISVTEDPEVIYVTGKLWDRMFKVRLLA